MRIDIGLTIVVVLQLVNGCIWPLMLLELLLELRLTLGIWGFGPETASIPSCSVELPLGQGQECSARLTKSVSQDLV